MNRHNATVEFGAEMLCERFPIDRPPRPWAYNQETDFLVREPEPGKHLNISTMLGGRREFFRATTLFRRLGSGRRRGLGSSRDF